MNSRSAPRLDAAKREFDKPAQAASGVGRMASRNIAYTIGVPQTTTKLSISLPKDLLARADKLLARAGEGRSALLTRVLNEAVRIAEEAAIDEQYERAYRQHPVTQKDLDRTRALGRAAVRSTRRARTGRGEAV